MVETQDVQQEVAKVQSENSHQTMRPAFLMCLYCVDSVRFQAMEQCEQFYTLQKQLQQQHEEWIRRFEAEMNTAISTGQKNNEVLNQDPGSGNGEERIYSKK